jgi:polysaccharide export outer membrane protein
VTSKHRIWLARPEPGHPGCCNTFPVDWNAIARCADTRTNYQVLPGDRIYMQAEPLVTLDSALARIFVPIERVLGVTLLGRATVGELAVPLGTTTGGVGGGGF